MYVSTWLTKPDKLKIEIKPYLGDYTEVTLESNESEPWHDKVCLVLNLSAETLLQFREAISQYIAKRVGIPKEEQ